MRVLTLNVWGVRGDWGARRGVLVPGLRELEPDLFAFTEAIKTDDYAGDLSSDPDAANVRFITGRQSLERTSACYRDAWEAIHPDERGETSKTENPLVADWDWPFKRLDYVFVRCGDHGGPTLEVAACERIFDHAVDGVWASDHFGVWADLDLPRRR
ncbi:MAG TPA: hypothetical protein VF063_07395 [Gaiellaceae bacterium]